MKVAVTLFNFRDYCKTEEDLDASLDKICAIGYKFVQVSAINLPAEVIKKQLDKHDLKCVATHENYSTLKDNLQAVADKLDILECDYVAIGCAPKDMRNVEGMIEVGKTLEIQGAALKQRGKILGYHNHCFEFDKQDSEKILFEHLFDQTTPENVASELDVHWVTRGGGNPVKWIYKMQGRIPVIHFKDFTIVDNQPVFCEIGYGNLDWPDILEACKAIGVKVCSIEQDTPFKDRNIFDSAKMSFDFLKSLGL